MAKCRSFTDGSSRTSLRSWVKVRSFTGAEKPSWGASPALPQDSARSLGVEPPPSSEKLLLPQRTLSSVNAVRVEALPTHRVVPSLPSASAALTTSCLPSGISLSKVSA